MNDRYKEYRGVIFKYSYPFTWEDRNKNYLEVIIDRDEREEQTFMFPPKMKRKLDGDKHI